jgi:hypothetical protein
MVHQGAVPASTSRTQVSWPCQTHQKESGPHHEDDVERVIVEHVVIIMLYNIYIAPHVPTPSIAARYHTQSRIFYTSSPPYPL